MYCCAHKTATLTPIQHTVGLASPEIEVSEKNTEGKIGRQCIKIQIF